MIRKAWRFWADAVGMHNAALAQLYAWTAIWPMVCENPVSLQRLGGVGVNGKQCRRFPQFATNWHLVHCHTGWGCCPGCWRSVMSESHANWPSHQGCESGTQAHHLMNSSSYLLWQHDCIITVKIGTAGAHTENSRISAAKIGNTWCCKIHGLFLARCWMSIRLAKACTFCLVAAAHSNIWCHISVA